MAAGVCLWLYHMEAELPRVVAQRIEENEVQVMEFQSDETQVVVFSSLFGRWSGRIRNNNWTVWSVWRGSF